MRKLMLPVVVPIGLILTHCVSPTASGPDQDTLITEERVEWLGNPTARRWPANGYARNVWDLQAFGGRLYIGCGDMDQNAGPVPLYSYDPAEEMFVRKALFWEEQIGLFRVIEGRLYAPGFDAKWSQSWNWGNFYRLEKKGWTRYRNLPGGAHVLDMYGFGGRLFAGMRSPDSGTIAISTDDGNSWKNVDAETHQITTFFEVGGRLYAIGDVKSEAWRRETTSADPTLNWPWGLWVYNGDGSFELIPDADFASLFPGVEGRNWGASEFPHRPVRSVTYI